MAPTNNAIPGILPPQTQMDLADEMGRLGYDATGATEGKGWKEYTKFCKDNPGSGPVFDEVRKKLSSADPNTPLGQLEISMQTGVNWIDSLKGKLTNTFSKNSFNPDDQEIYAHRDDIRQQFVSQIIDHDIKGTPVNPLVAERMEQLMIKHPDEVDARTTQVMHNVLDNPGKYGLQTQSPGYFSKNAGDAIFSEALIFLA